MIELLKRLVEALAPALAVALWNFEEDKVSRAKVMKQDAETNLQLEKNHEAVNAKYADSSDSSIVGDAIAEGGGDRRQLESDPTTTGNNSGSKGNS